ncbi:MAG TPA: myo-inosose-2 dehydratase [Caulobacteraceae bacterium]|nr:myo-inosose-2 dehydratase [Caulobacteraceae bacterium]
MSVRFGVSPIAWANDDMPELGADTSVETILADAAQIGFSGVELGGRFPRDAGVLGPMLARERLALIGGWWSTRLLTRSVEDEIAAMAGHIALLKALGSTVFIAAETSNAVHGDRARPLAERPRLSDWAGFGAALNRLAAHCAGQGLAFAYHFHLGTVVEDQADVGRFIAATGSHVGFVVDTGHAALGGVDAARLIREHPQRVAHVHAKDVRPPVFERVRRERMSFLDGVLAGMFTAPGDGALNFAPVMAALAGIGYAGWVVIEAEQDPNLADPVEYGRLGLRTLRAAAEAAHA